MRVDFTAENNKKMAGAKSEKETRLNYNIQRLARYFFDAISFVQLIAANDLHVFFSLKHSRSSDNLFAVYYSFETP